MLQQFSTYGERDARILLAMTFLMSVDSCVDLLCSPCRVLRVGRDAALSSGGHKKAAEDGALTAEDDFSRTAGIELCVHSPLAKGGVAQAHRCIHPRRRRGYAVWRITTMNRSTVTRTVEIP